MADRKQYQGTKGLTLDDAIRELDTFLEDADDFMSSELEADWEAAERYYKGETDLEEVEGRSNVTKTEVRDAIRNTLPSVMRILLQARKPVAYIPSSVQHGMWVEQQSEYVAQLFWANNGYMQLIQSITEALKLKIGILKVWWEPLPRVDYVKMTGVTEEVLNEMLDDPMLEVLNYDYTQLGDDTDIVLYDVEAHREHPYGKIMLEAVPNYEFFISRNANSIEHALDIGVHGQRGLITVAEALEMGIPDDIDWMRLDDEDPEQSDHSASSQSRRAYTKNSPNDPSSVDVLKREFLLTECYVRYDLEDEGMPQTYKFFMGGTNRVYLHHERVEDSPFALMTPYITPFTVYGESMADLTMNEQDTSTSLLRALVDNAHAANGVKIAADPSKTNFDDVMNPALNAPIRKRAGDTIQTVQVPFTGQGNLATLQYLDQDVQNKVGVTKAAQGLDPDAMQSTDKNAVMNTIMTGQGQTELVVRNIIESCLIRVFKLMMRLSIRHHNPIQLLQTKGKNIPINIQMFDPDAVAMPMVGLGTASPMQKMGALQFIYAEQQKAMDKYGPNNPFTSMSQVYNTLEDMVETNGIHNVGRYFNMVTPEVEKEWAQAQEQKNAAMQKQAQENQPMDPSKAFLTVEAQKAEVKKIEIATNAQVKANEMRLDAVVKQEELDIKRDELVMKTNVETLKVGADAAKTKEEQKSNERISTSSESSSEKSA